MSINKTHRNWKTNNELLKALSLLGQLGLVMAVSILLFIILGVWVDNTLGFKGFGVGLCSFLGIACGGLGVYKLLVRHYKNDE